MPGERLSMRKIREVLRLRLGHKLPQRAVAQSLRLSQGAISGYLGRARRAGLSWPLPEGRRAAGGIAVSAAARCGPGPTPCSGLGSGAPGAAAAKRNIRASSG